MHCFLLLKWSGSSDKGINIEKPKNEHEGITVSKNADGSLNFREGQVDDLQANAGNCKNFT